MKILYYMKNFSNPKPGAQRTSLNILKALVTENPDFQFVILTDKIAKKSNSLTDRAKKHVLYAYDNPKLAVPGLNFHWENFLAERHIQRLSRKVKPDLIHVQGYAGFYPRSSVEIPSILTFHDFPPWDFPKPRFFEPTIFFDFLWSEMARHIRLKNIEYYTHFHALSTQIAEFLKSQGVDLKRIAMIPNGFNHFRSENSDLKYPIRGNFRRKMGFNDDDVLILMVGTIEYRKGIHLASAALEYLPPNCHLMILGRNSRISGSHYLKTLLKGENSSRIHYLGHIPSQYVSKILGLADCFLSASLSEACQISVLEASNYGLPVVLTNVGAASDIFGSDYPFLVPRAEPEVLASKIRLAIASNREEEISVNTCTWNSVGKMLGNFYRIIAEETLRK